MSEMLRGHVQPIGGWDDVVAWLASSFEALDVGDVLEVGQAGQQVFAEEDEEPVACAQVQALSDGVAWLRLSTDTMAVPLLSDLSSHGLELNEWHSGEIFDDCTDGYLICDDMLVLAEACATWFRDRQSIHYSDLGCEHHRARAL